jgi:peptidoglycan/xylan/chitin deacetylase (PgdA/CDA1 family)
MTPVLLRKYFISGALFVLFSILFTGSVAASSIPVLQYHYIGPVPNINDKARKELSVSVESFETQMKFLTENGYEPLTLGYMPYVFGGSLYPSGKKPVVLTFDDGYMDFYFNAFPILKKYGFHAVSFISTGLVGKSYYMTWDQIKEIQRSGLVEFEAHSVNHVNLAQVNSSRLMFELKESKKVLEEEIGHPVHYLSYPFGIYNQRVAGAASSLGYVGGFTERSAKAYTVNLAIPRIKLGGRTSLAEFKNKLK